MDFPRAFFAAVLVVSVISYLAFQQYLRQQRRQMIHRERLVALEKGLTLAPVQQEIERRSSNVQRILMLAGLVWISVGFGVVLVLYNLAGQTFHIVWGLDRVGNPFWMPFTIRDGMQWAGLAFIGIGISHIIVYAMGRDRV